MDVHPLHHSGIAVRGVSQTLAADVVGHLFGRLWWGVRGGVRADVGESVENSAADCYRGEVAAVVVGRESVQRGEVLVRGGGVVDPGDKYRAVGDELFRGPAGVVVSMGANCQSAGHGQDVVTVAGCLVDHSGLLVEVAVRAVEGVGGEAGSGRRARVSAIGVTGVQGAVNRDWSVGAHALTLVAAQCRVGLHPWAGAHAAENLHAFLVVAVVYGTAARNPRVGRSGVCGGWHKGGVV